MNRVTFTVLGYVLLLIGMLSMILGFIGLSLQPLAFLERTLGPLCSFIVKLTMVVVGLIMFYMSRIPPEED